jgi:hypothetical protein
MKKLRRAHLWIGLIASIFIFVEALTGLLMNEPWLVGQSQAVSGRANFQLGQFYQGQNGQGNSTGAGQASSQVQGQGATSGNGQVQGRGGFRRNANFTGFGRNAGSQGILGTIRNLHEGRIGNTNVKWLLDLVALAMMALTATGVYLSINVLRAESKRKKRQGESFEESAN